MFRECRNLPALCTTYREPSPSLCNGNISFLLNISLRIFACSLSFVFGLDKICLQVRPFLRSFLSIVHTLNKSTVVDGIRSHKKFAAYFRLLLNIWTYFSLPVINRHALSFYRNTHIGKHGHLKIFFFLKTTHQRCLPRNKETNISHYKKIFLNAHIFLLQNC